MTDARPADGRVVFIDVARVLATLMMLFGHTFDALLSSAYRGTTAFNVWTFLRALTPTTFTLVSGFALSLVALHVSRRETAKVSGTRRLKRFAFFLVLGYALHYPAANLKGLTMLTAADWRLFTSVDVLQCIAVTLAVLQLIALRVREPGRFLAISGTLAVIFCWFTPLVWRWVSPLPMSMAAYLNPSTGSIFPLFPWLANGALGAALGAWYLIAGGATPGARARRTLLPIGVLMFGAAVLMRTLLWEPFGAVDLGAGRPSQFLLQAGLVCMLLAGLASLVDLRPARIPTLEDLAQESLTIYIVHVCIVYGSPWNRGLRQVIGPTLEPAMVGLFVLALWTAMITLGLGWSAYKRDHRMSASRMRLATLGVLFVLLLV
ncbi:MAG: heparan-alpha-glucosaminide N-acetyltransferase domain-containing protein [Vicinamibacterales bacterium]